MICCARCRASCGVPGHLDEAERAGHEAVALLEPLGDGPELAMAYANMASLAMNHEDARGAADWGERALALADDGRSRSTP